MTEMIGAITFLVAGDVAREPRQEFSLHSSLVSGSSSFQPSETAAVSLGPGVGNTTEHKRVTRLDTLAVDARAVAKDRQDQAWAAPTRRPDGLFLFRPTYCLPARRQAAHNICAALAMPRCRGLEPWHAGCPPPACMLLQNRASQSPAAASLG
jgi:hypothetical protein